MFLSPKGLIFQCVVKWVSAQPGFNSAEQETDRSEANFFFLVVWRRKISETEKNHLLSHFRLSPLYFGFVLSLHKAVSSNLRAPSKFPVFRMAVRREYSATWHNDTAETLPCSQELLYNGYTKCYHDTTWKRKFHALFLLETITRNKYNEL